MSSIFNAVKEKFNRLKMLRMVLISLLVLTLIVSVTLAWYINNTSLWGIEFNTGTIDFNTYVYDKDGVRLVGPVSSNDENESNYINAPLITIEDGQVGTVGTAYIAVESTGSIGIQYRIAFDITGRNEKSTAFLGGYKYNISKVTDKVEFTGAEYMDVSNCPWPEEINDEVVTIDKNAVNGSIETKNDVDVYRVDYTLVHKNEEYTGGGISIYFNIFATQIDGDFDEEGKEKGYTYYCSTREDIDRARVEAYPGDIIKLTSDIIYYGDLVFNKPVSLETNDFTLTVNGNLMYDYVLNNSLKIDAGGLGKIVVQCTKDGVGGNFQIKAPLSDVALIGSNAANGDIVVEKGITIDATNDYGAPGVSFNEVRIVNLKNSRKTIQLESNTRATVSFGTTIGALQSVVKASNIEIVNNGEIGEINLSNMSLLEQTNSPQIYILNNNDINTPIMLPSWSVKFQEDADGNCTGNTKIVQSYSGSPTEVEGTCDFDNPDIEVERKDFLVEQIEEGNDSRLRIYYQDVDGKTTTIQSILEDYLKNEASTGCAVNEVLQIEIVSIGDKAVTIDDISFMNSDEMLSLKQLDMQEANVYDRNTDTYHKLPAGAFYGVSKYESLILPQNLTEIGYDAFRNSGIENIITVPSGVTAFGTNWFNGGDYVRFAASVPLTQAADGLTNVKAIFVDEAYISSYKSVYSQYETKIYPTSVLDETKEHFIRNTQNDEWEITYYISGEDAVIGENITIDSTILKITSVYDNAYRHNFNGTKIKFADTVENLGAGNFYGNKQLREADLNKLKYVGDRAFSNASVLGRVTFGNSLVSIGLSAFSNCVSLNQEVVLPDTMQKIGAAAFQKTKITAVNTGGTTSLDGAIFSSCTDLLCAELPNVKAVGENGSNELFTSCSKLVSVKMPALAKVNGARMFASCVSLRELYMATNDDDVSLGSNIFPGCDMTKIKLYVPEEYLAFFQSKRPGNITATMIYPEGEKMGEELVNGFNIGTYIVSDNGNDTYTLITSNISYSDSLVLPETFDGKPITHIYTNAFRNQSFTNVTLKLGNNLQSIGSNAFQKRNGLIKVEFGDSLKVIASSAFAECVNLVQDVILPASMERIGNDAFRDTGILSIDTGGTTSVEGLAFSNCKSLVYAKMPEVTTFAESGTNRIFSSCTSLVSVEIPKAVKVSGSGMFAYCSDLAEVYMSSDDTSVSLGTSPFASLDASKIKLFVPENLVLHYRERNIVSANAVYPVGEKIGTKAVNGFVIGDYVVMENDDGYTLVTSNLEFEGDVIVPNEYNGKPITEIYTNAFRNQAFTNANIILGYNVKTIGNGAFYGTSGLKSVVMDQVTTIGADAFYETGIEVLNAPKLISVGNNAFRKCVALENISIPKIETVANTYVFAECTNLKSVYFENVLSLNAYTFHADEKLERITINRQIDGSGANMPSPMTIDSKAPCKIYVPYRSLTSYPDVWSGKPVVTFDISATYNGDTYILVDNNGRYALIDFIPTQTTAALTIPATVSTVEIGDISIYSIESGAFSAVSETMKSLTLSSTIAQLNRTALSECTALENIYAGTDNVYFTSIDGVLYSEDSKMLVKYPIGRSGQFDMSGAAYESTIGIAAGAFANATKLTQIIFPTSLMVIDSTAFANCSQLNTVEFTGNTPPILMGTSIFNTAVEDFRMVVPTAVNDIVTTYLYAYNFAEYEPYIVLPEGYEKPTRDLVTSVGIPDGLFTGSDRGQQIATLAQTYVGYPYAYGGSSPEGFDCSGFVQYVYQQNGIVLNRTASDQLEDGYRVAYGDMLPGDIVYFGADDVVTHVGIYIGDGKFVHAQGYATGVVETSMFDTYYANRFICAHRIVD